MTKNQILYPLLLAILFGSCSFAPEYRKPAAPIPDKWPSGPAYNNIKADEAAPFAKELMWQEFITDRHMQEVIKTAIAYNRDMRIASLNVQRARALYGVQKAELWPQVSAVGLGVKERMPADLSPTGTSITAEQYSVDVGITSWELDFFGRIRNLKKRALEEYLATDAARRSAEILLITSTATAYLSLAADHENLNLARFTLEAQKTSYDLIRKRFNVGLASELDLRRAQSQVDAAKGDVALYTQLTAQDENALRLLIGQSLPSRLLPANLSSVIPPREISAGLSSELLLRRPDVIAAEHRLKASHANIGAARAAFFPRITLTSAVGTASTDLSGLFNSGSGVWSFMPRISIPIFDPRIGPAYEVTKVDKEIILAQYEDIIQKAFREAADALAIRGTVNERIRAQQDLVEAIEKTYRLSNARYLKGIDSYLGVLDAQRSLYAAQEGLINLYLLRLINRVTLYQVLGGGDESSE
ncbi:MAG: efflux transporter outer membrane subunit [Syntrophales bacterium]|jgi:multidrug efflux system outer membrane protein|nr:efflux transporter outer membrane subunit [Syntrophales bacterium]